MTRRRSRGAGPTRGPHGTAGVDWSGLLPVDKPAGPTSHDVVARARRRLGVAACGHLGTLDPGATGLLVLALGAATRCASVWQSGDKTYQGTARFGVVTDSQDADGRVLSERAPEFDAGVLAAATSEFLGARLQVPPMVSAVRVGGERLHAMARRGLEVERVPRPIRVDAWEWEGFGLPEMRFTLRCSGGTYVRTLVHDLGARLGCGASLASLRRLRSDPFDVSAAAPWSALNEGDVDAVVGRYGVPLDHALRTLPELRLDADAVEAIGHGRRPRLARAEGLPVGAGARSVVLRDAGGRALALAELRADDDGFSVCPHVVFPWAVRTGRTA